MSEQQRATLDGPDAGTGEDAVPRYSPVCTYCRWWQAADGRSCAAYPSRNSIPMRIWASVGAGNAANGYNHLLPQAGDHGKRFALAKGAKAPAWLARARKMAADGAAASKTPKANTAE